MHPLVLEWVQRVLTVDQVKGAIVLEVGSYDVNGSVRPYIESLRPAGYLGVDVRPGPGVDRVANCENLTAEVGHDIWDIVISKEMLEHVRDWQTCVEQMAAATIPNGLLLITTRSPGFPYHPFPEDHWRFTVNEMKQIFAALEWETITVEDDPEPSCPGVFVMARKPFDRLPPNYHRPVWESLGIPEGRFDA